MSLELYAYGTLNGIDVTISGILFDFGQYLIANTFTSIYGKTKIDRTHLVRSRCWPTVFSQAKHTLDALAKLTATLKMRDMLGYCHIFRAVGFGERTSIWDWCIIKGHTVQSESYIARSAMQYKIPNRRAFNITRSMFTRDQVLTN